jgi:hypothetical protein
MSNAMFKKACLISLLSVLVSAGLAIGQPRVVLALEADISGCKIKFSWLENGQQEKDTITTSSGAYATYRVSVPNTTACESYRVYVKSSTNIKKCFDVSKGRPEEGDFIVFRENSPFSASAFITKLTASVTCDTIISRVDSKQWSPQMTIKGIVAASTSPRNTQTSPTTQSPANTPPTNQANTPKVTGSVTPAAPYPVSVPDYDAPTGKGLKNLLSAESVPEFLVQLMKVLLGLLGGIAVIVILYGAFRMATSQGNPTATGAAKKTIIWALAGLVLALLSYSIVAVLQGLLQ